MKKILLPILLAALLVSCTQKLIPNTKGRDSLIGRINEEVRSKKIASQPVFYLSGEKITAEELALLNEFEPKVFTSIDFLAKAEATERFGAEGKGGAVLITPFVDEALTMRYYEGISNKLVQALIAEYAQKGLIKQNPVLVVNGVPLRGEEISETINRIGEEGIQEVNLLKRKTAYEIYGIRAVNGVLVIDTKQ